MTAQEVEAKLDQDLSVVSGWLFGAWLVGAGSIVIRYLVLLAVGKHLGALTVTGLAFVSILWALAWLASGFLFGFLFGIPKVLQQDSPNAGSSHLKVNTNLEDISDWLTKILVGATLTQLMKIPAAVSIAAQFMAHGDNDPSRVSFNAAILVYFLMLGILAGYLLTRMFFAVAFSRADSAPSQWAQIVAQLGGAPIALGEVQPQAASPATQSAAVAAKSIPLTQSLSAEQAVAVAVGASITNDPDRALKASMLAVQQSPNDPGAQFSYALALYSMQVPIEHTLAAMESAATKSSASTDKSLLESIYTSLTYLYLFQKPPDSYQHAFQAAADYDKKGGRPSASIEINRACAYAQMFGELRISETSAKDAGEARNAALAAAKRAIDLEPQAALARLKQLLWVTGAPEDDDLAVFQNDTDFTTLLPKD